ncbi:MAG: histidinol-phosphatase HisJ family protein, partial [Clostridiales bacterium]|nr:histidinol-phosphatase HisJ family protein [Clostridiales bacterium]
KALLRGDKYIGFADHCEYNMKEFDPNFQTPDFDVYFAKLSSLSQKFADIKILFGVELGYSDKTVNEYKSLLEKYSFDHVILSIHTVEKRGDCYMPSFYDGLDKREAYTLYLDETLKAVRSDMDFQILGHVGYISRYAPYPDNNLVYGEFSDIIDKILKTVIDRGAAIELNTSAAGLPFDIITDRSIIARYIELGGKNFSFGSDAHTVKRYAENADKVKRLLTSFGINYALRFECRKPIREYFE